MSQPYFFKSLFIALLLIGVFGLQGCSTNPATGASQFTAFMSPAQENQVGAQEHSKIVAQFGLYKNPSLNNYVQQIGDRVTAKTERPDVNYKFFVLDSPIVNAFALPGGYIYLSRGLMALANNEAEMAAVLAHEAGHVTGRHSAERYSRGVVTSLGASILSATIDTVGVSQALNLGSELYLKSYSRHQENEADSLGIRYLQHAGYDPRAMTWFLESLKASSDLESKIDGRTTAAQAGYFSTHPATQDRVNKTRTEAASIGGQGLVNRQKYLDMINGMTYGDSTEQGFAKLNSSGGQTFYHPTIGFAYDVPKGYRVNNQPRQVTALGPQGTAIIFDMAKRETGQDAASYLGQTWMKGKDIDGFERITVNGMGAATASFRGAINQVPMVIRVIAIEFAPDRFVRFQIGIPNTLNKAGVEDLKRTTYSFRKLSTAEKAALKPLQIRLVVASAGDTVQSLAAKQKLDDHKVDYFRVLNGLAGNETVRAGQLYKIITR